LWFVAESSSAFDHLAAGYDVEEATNPVRRRMRRISIEVLISTFPPGARLLDIGAGTGTEALQLVARGHRVVAVDESRSMLERLRAKVPGLEAHQLRAGELHRLDDCFDGAYSSFGPLNTEPDLAAVARELGRLVRPQGSFVSSVMNRWSLTDPSLRRLRARVAWHGTSIYYPSLKQFRAAFKPWFDLERAIALPLFVPPPAAGWSAAWLEWLDDRLATRVPWRGLGDHFLTVLRRRPD
jgi:SAM-dependent methyltransferase